MRSLILPPLLEEKLSEDRLIRSVVDDYVHEFSAWFDDSKTPFFPDFTNHGIQHVENVLGTAVTLISAESVDLFSANDASILILATLFHDCAMHLSEAGVFELIYGDFQKHFIPPFDHYPWRETWDRFLFTALRWDDAKLIEVVGADEAGVPRAPARDPFREYNNLTEGDRRIVGEFIRRHHARLGHEVAVFGAPGNKGLAIPVNERLTTERRDLAGLVARSHNLPIRACLGYLKRKFGNCREYQGVHAVYLMALLRVADYLQIDADRSPEIAFKYKFIPSNISTLEREAHLAVRYIAPVHDDPESLQVHAKPERVAVFLRVQEWLTGIQSEFDSSWAVLGETYGANEHLRLLGLRFRRITSNFDYLPAFSETVDYVPGRVRFDVARPELLKLLIGPLYGDDPSYGIRELIQNAVDAIREYDNYILHHPDFGAVERRVQSDDVVVQLCRPDEKGIVWLICSDRGIGMTEEIIRDYFLRAGASFRKSDQWRAEFEKTTESNTGKAKSSILRSGRFGVGALAAFLIGDEIIVETRHVAAPTGFRFATTLDSDAIEVIRDSSLPVGTSVKVRVNPRKIDDLIGSRITTTRPRFWDWFCLDYPSVARIFPKKTEPRQCRFQFNLESAKGSWRKLSASLPYEVFWTTDAVPALTCNGLFICDGTAIRHIPSRHLRRNETYFLKYPNVAVLDPDGEFPLRLQRDGLRTDDYPFGEELVRDYLRDMLAWVFFHGPISRAPLDPRTLDLREWLGYGKLGEAFVIGPKGFGLRISTLLNRLFVRHALFVEEPTILTSINLTDSLLFVGNFETLDYHRTFAPISFQDQRAHKIKPTAVRHLEFFQSGIGSGTERQEREKSGAGLSVEMKEGDWQISSSAKCPPRRFEVQEWPKTKPGIWPGWRVAATEMFFPNETRINATPWLVDDLWHDLFGSEWLPYNFEERLTKFPQAAKELKAYRKSAYIKSSD